MRPPSVAPLAALALLACAPHATGPAAGAPATARTPGGVVQRVAIAPATARRGDTVTVTSTLVNQGTAPADVTVQVCGLGLEAPGGVLAADNGIRCVAYSVALRLAPGDSTAGSDRRLVTAAAPGRYAVRVTHLLRPALAATATVDVARE